MNPKKMPRTHRILSAVIHAVIVVSVITWYILSLLAMLPSVQEAITWIWRLFH